MSHPVERVSIGAELVVEPREERLELGAGVVLQGAAGDADTSCGAAAVVVEVDAEQLRVHHRTCTRAGHGA